MPAHEPMIAQFRFPENSSGPVEVFFNVVEQPEFKRTVDLARMKDFAERSSNFIKELHQESDRGALVVRIIWQDR
jgi:hypothetical protein